MRVSPARRRSAPLLGGLVLAGVLAGASGCGFTVPTERVTGTVEAKHTTPNRAIVGGVPMRVGSIYYLTVRTCDTGPDCDRTVRVGAETYRDSRVGETVDLGN